MLPVGHDARTSALGDELWVSDGTSAGTRLFADLNPGRQSSLPTSLSVAADRLFFAAFDPGLRRDVLCITDGVGVQRVANGAGTPTNPRRFRVSGYRVYFTATTGPGTELALFQSDGTIAGTHRVEDIRRGPQSSDILEYQLSGGKVYLSATDGWSATNRSSCDAPAQTPRATAHPARPRASRTAAHGRRRGSTCRRPGSARPCASTDPGAPGPPRLPDPRRAAAPACRSAGAAR